MHREPRTFHYPMSKAAAHFAYSVCQMSFQKQHTINRLAFKERLPFILKANSLNLWSRSVLLGVVSGGFSALSSLNANSQGAAAAFDAAGLSGVTMNRKNDQTKNGVFPLLQSCFNNGRRYFYIMFTCMIVEFYEKYDSRNCSDFNHKKKWVASAGL